MQRTGKAERSHRAVVLAVAAAITIGACGDSANNATDPTPTSSSPPTSAVPATTTPSPSTTNRPTDDVDEFVDVGGARMHVHCEGAGGATVILISGFTDGESNWHAITPTLSERARVCTFARFGTGTSDPPPHPQTFISESADLHSLLSTIGEPAPYVVIGHSFGGAVAVTFTATYPGEVSGVVLIDASPSTWTTTACAVPDDGSEAAKEFVDTCEALSDPASNAEHFDGSIAFADVAAITSLGSVPMTVMTAASHDYPGLSAAEAARLAGAWSTGQQQWAALSTAATLVQVDDTGHFIQLDQPQVVTEQILNLLGDL